MEVLNLSKYSFYFDLTATGPMYRVKQAVRQALWNDSKCPIRFSEHWAGQSAIVTFKQEGSPSSATALPYTYAGEVTFVDEGSNVRLYVSMDVDLRGAGWLEQIQLRVGLPKVFKKRFEAAVKTTESPSQSLD